MILTALFNLIKFLLIGIISLLSNLPSFPTDIITYLFQYLDYIFSLFKLVDLFVPMDYAIMCISLTFAIKTFIYGYKFVWWFIRKIPFIEVKE